MSLERWTAVDDYISEHFVPADTALEATLKDSAAAGLPAINVSPNQGKFLHLLAKVSGARRILEIGTLGGYSTIWLARALPTDGRLVTLEFEPKHVTVAQKNIARAGLADVVNIRQGAAAESLRQLIAEKTQPFDFIFVDADKEGYAEYFALVLKLSRPGTCIVADNVVRGGGVLDPNNADPRVQGIQRFYEAVAAEPRVTATSVQTVGSKGYDGFTMILVK